MGLPRRAWVLLAVAAAVVLSSRVLFLPPTLEDIDSVNFALALRDYDPALHQPHPPGFPVYVAVARVVNRVVPDPVRALSVPSALAQAALVLPLFLLFRRLGQTPGRAAAATVLVLANPILWFNGARPMSDSLGLLLVTVSQVLLLHGAQSPRALVAGSAASALAAGVRVQAVLLTVPLWLDAMARARRGRAPAALAYAAGLVAWVVPLVLESGGPAAYRAAFGSSLQTSLPVEPLATTFTINRAVKTAWRASLAPWISAPLGATVVVLAVIGLIVVAWRRSPALRPALLAFAPYAAFHYFFQQTRTLRYSMPYVPLFAWLAVEGLAWMAERGRVRVLPGAIVAGLAAWSAARTVPALAEYHRQPSPPYAALQAVAAEGARSPGSLVSGHYMFRRYLTQAPPALPVLETAPGREIAQLQDHWRSGGAGPILFLAEGDRTDLESVAPSSRRVIQRWRWRAARRFFRGERPNMVELVRIERPGWFAGEGWLLSLEAGGLPQLRAMPERRAFLARQEGPSFLLVAGQPTAADAGQFELDLSLAGRTLERRGCGEPLLRGYDLPPLAGGDYAPLVATTRRAGVPAGAPFALNGLAYGGADEPGFVHGEGWFYPESDERAREFRWTSRRARSLLHVPPGGARLVVEGLAPCEYVGKGLGVGVSVEGTPPVATVLQDRPFRLEVDLPDGPSFREAALTSDRSFVPDRVQKNRDRRDLALRVYGFRLEPRTGPRAPR